MRAKLLFFIQKLREEGSFIRNISIASFWNAAVIASQFILSPIITRLYTPAEYGQYALFNSLVVNIALFSSLKYTETIVLAETREQRNNAISLSFSAVIIFSALTAAGVFTFYEPLSNFFDVNDGGEFLYFIPLGVLITCTLEIVVTINVRQKKFLNNGFAGFLNNVSARFFNILYALLFKSQTFGLIAGDFVGKLVGIAGVLSSYRIFLRSSKEFVRSVSLKGMMFIAQKYKSFPLYFLPSSVLIYLSGHLPLYFFQTKYSSAAVGAYALASSMLEIFNRLIPYALSPVFLQKATELKNTSPHHLAERSFKLFGYMLLLATLLFSGFALVGDRLFPFVFGKEWTTAGTYVAILSVPYAFNFVAVSLSEIYNVMGRQRFLLANSIFNLFLKIVSVVVILLLEVDQLQALFIYSVFSAVGGIFLILGVFVILHHRLWRVTSFILVSFTLLLLALFLGVFII